LFATTESKIILPFEITFLDHGCLATVNHRHPFLTAQTAQPFGYVHCLLGYLLLIGWKPGVVYKANNNPMLLTILVAKPSLGDGYAKPYRSAISNKVPTNLCNRMIRPSITLA
jgi:hypothetical protein